MQMKERKRWLFFGLPFTFTTYEFTDDILSIAEGILNRKDNSCYMYKITDIELRTSLFERIFGLGTIICYTSDITHPTIKIVHIKNSKEVKNQLLETTEKHRIRRRSINMENLNAETLSDLD